VTRGHHYHFVVETPGGNLSKGMRQLTGVYTMQEIADDFSVHYSTVSRAVCRFEGLEKSNT
jgi:DNA-directed RNA polymerase specialized sigma54-like protein